MSQCSYWGLSPGENPGQCAPLTTVTSRYMDCGEGKDLNCGDKIAPTCPGGWSMDALTGECVNPIVALIEDFNRRFVDPDACYSDCLLGPTGPNPGTRPMTPEEAKAIVDGACEIAGKVAGWGGVGALIVGSVKHKQFKKLFVDWVVKHGGKALLARATPVGTAATVVASVCFLRSEFGWGD